MPHIRVRGIEKKELVRISKALLDDLEKTIGCPRDHITLEHISSQFIMDGHEIEGYPMVDVLWFDRGLDVRDKVAKAITHWINPKKYEDICVVFTNFQKDLYYENGEHF